MQKPGAEREGWRAKCGIAIAETVLTKRFRADIQKEDSTEEWQKQSPWTPQP